MPAEEDRPVTRSEAIAIAKQGGSEGATETLKLLGFDVSQPIEVQKDVAFLREARVGSQNTRTIIKRGVIGAAISGVCYLLWLGFKGIGHG